VLVVGGILLVAAFSPLTNPHGEGIAQVPGEPHLYDGLHSGLHYLVDADGLDAALARNALKPIRKTDTVVVRLEKGRRVTVNGLYRKSG
jgi:hypothetical protein